MSGWTCPGGCTVFELNRSYEVEGGMVPDGVVEAVDMAGNGLLSPGAGVEDGAPHPEEAFIGA